MNSMLPEGIQVVELGLSIGTSFCGRLLQGMGASVLQVEPSHGSSLRNVQPLLKAGPVQESALFSYLAAGKKAIAPDLQTDEGRRIALNAIEKSDVVLVGS